MAEKELKPKSFRIDDETAEKFKEISSQIGGNQQETLAKLIEAYKFQSGKAILTEKKADMEQFEKYVACLTRMYMGSLEDNQNITEVVRTEFEALLKSKDTTIADLQERLQKAKEAEKEAVEKKKQFEAEKENISVELAKTEKEYSGKVSNLEKNLADKDSLNKALTDSCNAFKSQLKEAEALKVQLDDLNALKTEIERLKGELKKKDFEHEKQMLVFEKEKQNEITALKEKHIQEVEHYQTQCKELLGLQNQQGEKKTSAKKKKATETKPE